MGTCSTYISLLSSESDSEVELNSPIPPQHSPITPPKLGL